MNKSELSLLVRDVILSSKKVTNDSENFALLREATNKEKQNKLKKQYGKD